MKERVVIVLTLILICSCTSSPYSKETIEKPVNQEISVPPYLEGSYFGDEVKLIENDHVYQLSAVQKEHFLDYFNDPRRINGDAIQRVSDYLENRLDNFNYYSDTFTASESLINNQGNCLSLAILTKSLADIAQVNINYQLIETEPVYQKQSNIVVSSQHIRTVLYRPFKNVDGIHFIPKRTYIDYFPTYNSRVLRKVNEAEFYSMYYANKSIEALLNNEIDLAYWTIRKALELKANDSNALNIMAIVHNKKGYVEQAEKLYLYGIKRSNENKTVREEQQLIDLLDNYHSLLKGQNRDEEADKIFERIGKRNTVNPYKWVNLGNKSFNIRSYKKAIQYYRRAVKIAPYLHEAYGGIARAEFQLGNKKSAEVSFDKAIKNSHKFEVQDMYQKKLDMLKHLITNNNPVIIKSDR